MIAGLFKTRAYSKRHYEFVMAFAVMVAIIVAYYFLTPTTKPHYNSETQVTKLDTSEVPLVTKFARSAPVRLEIPAIKVDTTFVQPLGLMPDRTVSVPDSYVEVGWFSGGATPGEVGPSVVLGHVDSVDGPAVFYLLGKLVVGDEISVTREDGTVAKFTVTRLERHPQSNFPTLDVYGATDTSELRLVTCSGKFNKNLQRYSHNLIVYAQLQ